MKVKEILNMTGDELERMMTKEEVDKIELNRT